LQKAYDQICKGNFEESVPTLCQVVRADRNSPTARRYLAFVLLQEGHAKEALGQLDALSKLQQRTTFDILLSGVANDMVGQRDKALELFREAMAREPQSDYYRIKTIDELFILLQYDEALKLATEGYNSAKDPKISAIYQQKIKKIHSIQRLTARERK
jgi:tetratricopeptide (TPR) repeat protein